MRFFALLFAAIFLTVIASAGEAELAHAIFIKVNGRTITQEQVIEVADYIIKREYKGVTPDDPAELEKIQEAAQRDLVRSLLIHDEAGKLGVRLDSSRIRYAVQQAGFSESEITPTIRRLIEADELFEDIMMTVGTPVREPSPREIKDFYSENRAEFRSNAFIIVRTLFLAFDRSRPHSFHQDQAAEIKRHLDAIPMPQRTDAFAEAAKKLSQDVFAEFGGLMTGGNPEKWIPKDFENAGPDGQPMFPPSMVEEIRRLSRPGDLRIAVSEDGVHLMYCENVRGGQEFPWEEARRVIDYILQERYRNQKLRVWLNQIYDQSDVRWHDGAVYEKENLTRILLPSEQVPQNE